MSEYRRGTRVVATEDLPGIPEGTPGKCGRGLGFAIKRYRVRFDNGVEAISVAHSKLVPEAEWPQFLAKRARAEVEAAQERARVAEARAAAAESRGLPAASPADTAEATAAMSPAAAEADAAPPTNENAGPKGTGDSSASSDSADDPRLAALLNRSKTARAATGVPAPTAAPAPAVSAPAVDDATSTDAVGGTDEPPARTAPPAGPERADIPEFVPGPEVDPGYAPAANRVSELLEQVRSRS
ncbi:hypothetical protein [Candidatus Poriferisodalis sp.]|uniref:hypothetical protein n=1 Tax=Candidatus Poriferisodalis sp. TaxID=3101277 RepID=UPI003B0297AC